VYTLLHGAKKNVGDFLIYQQAKMLIETHTGVRDFLELPRWQPLDGYLDNVNSTRAVVLCGGPGYSPGFYPNVFPLTSRWETVRVPVIPFGLGWVGQPMHTPEQFSFTSQSVEALRHIHDHCTASACRDVITEQILNRHGFENVVMSGCPVWYHLPSLGRPFIPPNKIRHVVVTTPQRLNLVTALRKGIRRHASIAYAIWRRFQRIPSQTAGYDWSADRKQRLSLNGQCRRLLTSVRRMFPDAALYCVFHRGLASDDFTSSSEAWSLGLLRQHAASEGYKIVNAAYDVDSIAFYENCDLHIGYRVHAHIRFLSMRKPSYLIQEDGRGLGLSTTLNLPDVSAHDQRAVADTMTRIDRDRSEAFARFQGVYDTIDQTYQHMVSFLHTLP
jgi:hypothetical protein